GLRVLHLSEQYFANAPLLENCFVGAEQIAQIPRAIALRPVSIARQVKQESMPVNATSYGTSGSGPTAYRSHHIRAGVRPTLALSCASRDIACTAIADCPSPRIVLDHPGAARCGRRWWLA